MTRAFVFPGQGSQFVGMGKELADNFASAKEVFQEVNDALSQDLFKIMVEGPESELTLTTNAQPALMAHSIAVVRILEKDFGIKLKDYASFVAGHSLGEYSAACAAGVFSLTDTAKLLRTRGDAMQKAVPWALEEWRPLSAFLIRMSSPWRKPVPTKTISALPPMTMPMVRLFCPAIFRQSKKPLKLPANSVPNVVSNSRSAHRFTVL